MQIDDRLLNLFLNTHLNQSEEKKALIDKNFVEMLIRKITYKN